MYLAPKPANIQQKKTAHICKTKHKQMKFQFAKAYIMPITLLIVTLLVKWGKNEAIKMSPNLIATCFIVWASLVVKIMFHRYVITIGYDRRGLPKHHLLEFDLSNAFVEHDTSFIRMELKFGTNPDILHKHGLLPLVCIYHKNADILSFCDKNGFFEKHSVASLCTKPFLLKHVVGLHPTLKNEIELYPHEIAAAFDSSGTILQWMHEKGVDFTVTVKTQYATAQLRFFWHCTRGRCILCTYLFLSKCQTIADLRIRIFFFFFIFFF